MKNNLYALGLTGVMALNGCGKNEASTKTESVPKTENSTNTETPETPGTLPTTNHNIRNYVQDLEGTYRGLVDGMAAEYTLDGGNCYLTLHLPGRVVGIYDGGCDNVADGVRTPNLNYAGMGKGLVGIFSEYSRDDLFRAGRERKFDNLLRAGWNLVKPENKVERDYQEELDGLLKP